MLIKLVFGNHLKRVQLEDDKIDSIDLEFLLNILRRDPNFPMVFTLRYMDDEMEGITIGSTEELKDAILVAKQSQRSALRINVLPSGADLSQVDDFGGIESESDSDAGFEFVDEQEFQVHHEEQTQASSSSATSSTAPVTVVVAEVNEELTKSAFFEETATEVVAATEAVAATEVVAATEAVAATEVVATDISVESIKPDELKESNELKESVEQNKPTIELEPAVLSLDVLKGIFSKFTASFEDVAKNNTVCTENPSIEFSQALDKFCNDWLSCFSDENNVRELQAFLSADSIRILIVDIAKAKEQSKSAWDFISSNQAVGVLHQLVSLLERCPSLTRLIPSTAMLIFSTIKVVASKDHGRANDLEGGLSRSATSSTEEKKKPEYDQTHKRVICNGCTEADPHHHDYIRGIRYKSAIVEDFDLCESCEATYKYAESHGPFLKIYTPKQAPQAIFCIIPETFPTSSTNAEAIDRNPLVSAFQEFVAEKQSKADEEKEEAKPILDCPSRHGLQDFVTRHAGYTCDKCHSRINANQPMKGCRTCNYDVCSNCYLPNTVVLASKQINQANDIAVASAVTANILEVSKAAVNAAAAVATSATLSPKPPVTDIASSLVRPQANIVTDVTFKDGAVVAPGQSFIKTWRIRNNGQMMWPDGVRIVNVGGSSLGAPSQGIIVDSIPAGHVADISIPLIAPTRPGRAVGYFRLQTNENVRFGHRLWVDINVDGTVAERIAATVAEPFRRLGDEIVSGMQRLKVDYPSLGGSVGAPTTTNTAAAAAPIQDTEIDFALVESQLPVNTSATSPNEKYAAQVAAMENMGFLNSHTLLEANDGDVDATIESMLGQQQQQQNSNSIPNEPFVELSAQQSTEAAQKQQDQEFLLKYSLEISTLVDMGFTDIFQCAEALKAANGDMEVAVQSMIAQQP